MLNNFFIRGDIMADFLVTNMTEFKTACETADATVILQNDIDANNWAFSTISVRCSLIDGQNHSISNVQFSSNFLYNYDYGSTPMTCRDLIFKNCIQYNDEDYCFIHHGSRQTNSWEFVNCQFQGLFYHFVYYSVTFTNCTFTLESGLKFFEYNSGLTNTYYNYCIFDFKTQYSNDNQIFFRSYPSNCYFMGTVRNTTTTINFFHASCYLQNCVVNVYITGTTSGSWQARILNEAISLYNIDRCNGAGAASAFFVGLSDADLKNYDAVAATGFPIVRAG